MTFLIITVNTKRHQNKNFMRIRPDIISTTLFNFFQVWRKARCK